MHTHPLGGIKYKKSTIANHSIIQKYFYSPMGSQRGKMKNQHVWKIGGIKYNQIHHYLIDWFWKTHHFLNILVPHLAPLRPIGEKKYFWTIDWFPMVDFLYLIPPNTPVLSLESYTSIMYCLKWLIPRKTSSIHKIFGRIEEKKRGVNNKTRFFRVYTRFCCGTAHAVSAFTRGFLFNFLPLIFRVFLNF